MLKKTLKPKNYIMLPFAYKQLKQIMNLRPCRLQNSKKFKKDNQQIANYEEHG